MSRGKFSYSTDRACEEIFDYVVWPDYGEDGFKQSATARALNPCGDRELSEMVFDMFCVLHSLDWYLSGDTGEAQYKSDVRRFKDKWLKRTDEDRIEAYKGDLTNFFNELLAEIENVYHEQ